MKQIHKFYDDAEMRNKNIVVMFSGGPDSVAMVHTLITYGCTNMRLMYIDYVNTEAAPNARENLEFVLKFAESNELKLDVVTVDIARDYDLGKGPEGNCRMAKKQIISGLVEYPNVDYVFLGHNLDDHLETVLMQLFRGAGAGTRGIPDMVKGKIVRPLVQVAKRDVEQYCADVGMTYFVDSQNYNTNCTRQFMRHSLIPMLESHYGKGIHKRIANIGKKFEDMYSVD